MIFLPEREAQQQPEAEVSGDKPESSSGQASTAVSRRRISSWSTIARRAVLAAGVVLLAFVGFEFTLSALLYDRSQVALLDSFKGSIVATNLDDPTAPLAEGRPIAILSIPSIRLDEVVVEGTSPDDLKLGPGHLASTPLPGEFGNAVFAGRRSTYGAPFDRLNELTKGNLIIVTTGQGRFQYKVSQVGRAGLGEASPLQGTLDNRLTLITSDSEFYPTGRLVVIAMLQGQAASIATRPPAPVASSDTGLSGNLIGLVLGVVFGQLLGAAIWAAFRVHARLPLSVTLMFAVPVVLALGVLAFTSLDLALPATL